MSIDSINTYNKKSFISPDNIDSMSAIHCKLYPDGKAVVRISDCHNSIRLWNNLNVVDEKELMLEKLENLVKEIEMFKEFIINN